MALSDRYQRLAKLLALGLISPMLLAQGMSHQTSTKNGVFTEEQAQRGRNIYQSKCAMCHGAGLEGQGPNSPLTGTAFLDKWNGQTVADLFTKTIVMMPAINPGSMTPKETADVISYILSANKFPAGKTELGSDPQSLGKISVVKP